jgi:hypothetical protein
MLGRSGVEPPPEEEKRREMGSPADQREGRKHAGKVLATMPGNDGGALAHGPATVEWLQFAMLSLLKSSSKIVC